ncbi:hypothetical protein HYS84_01975 [Candidatus Saccharibacteria bacterium]|nr:hypothetical protein [Candidatus Saccharibacteria bacterium]
MIIKVVAELEYRDWSEIEIHISAKLLHRGSPQAFTNPEWLREHAGDEDPFTNFGNELLERLDIIGVSSMFSPYCVKVTIPPIFGMIGTIWEIVQAVHAVVENSPEHTGIAFGVMRADNLFEAVDYIEDPSREQVEAMLNEVVPTLGVTPVRSRRGNPLDEPSRSSKISD